MTETALAQFVTNMTQVALESSSLPVTYPQGIVWMTPGPVVDCKGGDNKETSYLRQKSDEAQAKADAAIQAAGKADPLTQRVMDKATALDDWETGKAGPIDIHKMPTGEASIALFQDAMNNSEAGRLGRGTASMTGGTNPNYVASLDQENELRRHLTASGALEGRVETALGNKDIMLGNLGAAGEARNMNVAGMVNANSQGAQQRDLSWMMRPKPMGFLKQLALSAIGGSRQAVGAGG